MGRIHKILRILVSFSLRLCGPIIGTKFAIYCKFGALQVKYDIVCFLEWKSRNTWNLKFLHFLSKTGYQKYSRFCSLMSLSEEIYKFFEADRYTLVSTLLNNTHTNLVYVKEKSFSLVNWAFPIYLLGIVTEHHISLCLHWTSFLIASFDVSCFSYSLLYRTF